MKDLGQKLKNIRQFKNLTMEELANMLNEKFGFNVTRGMISRWENDKSEPMTMYLRGYAKMFGVSLDYLLGLDDSVDPFLFDNISPIETKKIPMLGEIACGEPILCNEDRESYVLVGTDIKADFCLRCKGDSMINARIFDGDIVFVRKQSSVDNGEIAVVVIDGEATLKRFFYYEESKRIELRPENPKYQSIIYTENERKDIYVLGKAIAFQGDVI